MIDALVQDLRYAFRHLRHSPGFAAAAILTLAFGIGANAAIFSVLNAIALRDLPVKDPSRLIAISTVNKNNQLSLTPQAIVALLERDPGPLQDMCAYNGGGVLAAVANQRPSQMLIELMSARCLHLFGVTPVIGRLFTEEEAPQSKPGAAVTVIGYRYWQRMFDGDPSAVGKTVKLDTRELTIVGVLPAGFPSLQLDAGADVLAPFGAVTPTNPARPPRLAYVIGRLRDDVSFETARAELLARWPSLVASVQPADLTASERAALPDLRAKVQPIGKGFSGLRERFEQPFAVVLGLTGLLLALVCANLGGLLLVRPQPRTSSAGSATASRSTPRERSWPRAGDRCSTA